MGFTGLPSHGTSISSTLAELNLAHHGSEQEDGEGETTCADDSTTSSVGYNYRESSVKDCIHFTKFGNRCIDPIYGDSNFPSAPGNSIYKSGLGPF